MKIYDISQELLGSVVFPGDPVPEAHKLKLISNGDSYNLTSLSMCAHNGTHVDAPLHFIDDGNSIEQIPIEAFVGASYVIEHSGLVSASDAAYILEQAAQADTDAARRILLKGTSVVTLEAAEIFADAGILLLGNESQTIGPEEAPMAVHKRLLGAQVVLLEGIRLAHVPNGVYLLSAAPINVAGSDGAPCRAVLIKMK